MVKIQVKRAGSPRPEVCRATNWSHTSASVVSIYLFLKQLLWNRVASAVTRMEKEKEKNITNIKCPYPESKSEGINLKIQKKNTHIIIKIGFGFGFGVYYDKKYEK